MKRIVVVLVLLLTLGWGSPAGAAPVPHLGTEALSDRLFEVTVFSPAMEREMRFRIILPEGYEASSERYPVLYLLHGVGDDHTTWTTNTDVEEFTRPLDLIVVMPDGGKGGDAGWFSDWYNGGLFGPPRWESHHIGELIGFVDSRYRTLAQRSQRLIAGLSMGGFGAMSYAARHPDLFVAAAGFSGAVDTLLGSPGSGIGFDLLGEFAGTPSENVWGPQATQEVRWRTHNPTDLAANLADVELSVVTGDGTLGAGDNPQAAPTEAGVRQMNDSFHTTLVAAGKDHFYEVYSPGTHEWHYWERELHNAMPRLLLAVGRPAPSDFSYRSAEPKFSLYGWTFEADREVMEFLEVVSASPSGVTLKGSGIVKVTTAPYFSPGEVVEVSTASPVTADSAGRLDFEVDLGPSHTFQEYTPAAEAEKLALGEGYWTTVAAEFVRAESGAEGPGTLVDTGGTPAVAWAGVVLLLAAVALRRWLLSVSTPPLSDRSAPPPRP